jgi:dipeptidase E
MASKRILAFSSSRYKNAGYLETAFPAIKNFLHRKATNIAFIPFASPDKNYVEYALRVKKALKEMAIEINIVLPENPKSVIEKCNAIMVGGGNTFKLLHDIYELDLMQLIKDNVNRGVHYIGWSAGSNILSPTIGTTNDMPIIEPKSFKALGLLPFQINPHYFNQKLEGFNGETREQRLEEFLKMNPSSSILALPEGTWLEIQNNDLKFFGNESATLFCKEKNHNSFMKQKIDNEANLSFLMGN